MNDKILIIVTDEHVDNETLNKILETIGERRWYATHQGDIDGSSKFLKDIADEIAV